MLLKTYVVVAYTTSHGNAQKLNKNNVDLTHVFGKETSKMGIGYGHQ